MKKIIILLISCIFLFSNSFALAEETKTSTTGQFTIISKGSITPFDGVLVDPYAVGVILADKETSSAQFKLKLEYELNQERLNSSLKEKSLDLSLQTEKEKNKQILIVKDREIERLTSLAAGKSDNTLLIASVSVVGGILLTLGVMYLYTKIEK